ncbi:hypothetical protein [Saccharothrix obliqua]|uniref:hypothetical protein n=1 Tax=Saccharothrix obliqua TaxID=2861747 RepID=UPI001C5D1204|nr:hypothetical protein [Saccharothrix obliqua]MBW4718210.1 hypothetical protein [Saccharothrix obliqua]
MSLVYDLPERVDFVRRDMDVDPAGRLPRLGVPLPALFGGADDFPRADHDLFTAPPAPDVPRGDRLAAGFRPLLTSFPAG